MAETRYVDGNTGADDPAAGKTPQNPWKTIQYSVDRLAALPAGAKTLHVDSAPAGGYKENVKMIGKTYSDITIVGSDAQGKALTILAPASEYDWTAFCEGRPPVDGAQKGHVFEIENATGVVLQDLNIQNGKAQLGAGVLATKSQVDLVRCCIHDNQAAAAGGAGGSGGGFAFDRCNPGGVASKIDTCVIFNNKADKDGAGGWIENNGGKIRVVKTLVHDNGATERGGGFAFSKCKDIEVLQHCVFGGPPIPAAPAAPPAGGPPHINRAKDGGAIAVLSNTGLILIGDPAATGNDKNWIDCNRASNAGGGIRIRSGRAAVTVAGTNLRQNQARGLGGLGRGGGGGIAVQQFEFADRPTPAELHTARLQLRKNTLIGANRATMGEGGGVFATVGSEVDIAEGVTIAQNSTGAAGWGGGISASECSNVTAVDAEIKENHADLGGGVYIHNGAMDLTGVAVEQNRASGSGGGIYASTAVPAVAAENDFIAAFSLTPVGRVTVSGGATGSGSISNNTAARDGGGLVCRGDPTGTFLLDVTLTGVSVSQNKAKDGGGAHVENARTVTIDGNCSFFQNTATGSGGGVYVDKAASLSVKDNTQGFVQNQAQSGGGFESVGCPVTAATLTNNTFDNNTLTGAGGSGRDGLFDKCTFTPATLALATHEQANRPGGAAQPSFSKK
jgi:predicted outer membrane repeat protein